ncbi:unnamed protein product [Tilletia caries]|uniref:Uncharacterized protein n=1 Tax=Tilletia caries TaxID=13290 RepID=A0ABN7J6Z0_9BASI|nr:unnamed protein product [Tilletia caries]CAD7065769.1 unnamed protein product [Tilletia caries]
MSEDRNRASLPNKPAASAGSALAVPASQVGQPRSARTSTLAKRTSSAADLPIDGAGAPKRLVATAPVAGQFYLPRPRGTRALTEKRGKIL